MFHDSTQRRHWLFETPLDIDRKRKNVNRAYCEKASHDQSTVTNFLSVEEESELVKEYTKKLLEFCSKFQPPVPKSTLTTACHYLRRFYVLNSVMDYHPQDVYLCCAYLAFKVEEYNLDADQFVQVLPSEDQKQTADLVLYFEPTLMLQLNFQLIVHSPFKSLEGFLVDMKVKCPEIGSLDKLRKVAEGFLMHHFYSDVSFFYPPSQIALAALMHSASHSKIDIDNYLQKILSDREDSGGRCLLIERLKEIERSVVSAVGPRQHQIPPIEAKLRSCRNEDNNPGNEKFWKKKKKDKEMPQNTSSSSNKRRKLEEEEVDTEEVVVV